MLNPVLLALAVAPGPGLALLFGQRVIQIRTGKRVLGWKSDRRSFWQRFACLSQPLMLAGLWVFLWYSRVPTQILLGLDNYRLFACFGADFHWITLVVCLWAAALSLCV